MNKSQSQGGLRTQGVLKNSSIGKPLVSIITVVFNGKKNIENTIKHIIDQDYTNFEFIVIDGGSTDGTVDILKKYENYIDYWVSEPDHGIGDAFNKGIKLSKGEYINFQGDGDGFCDVNSISRVIGNANSTKDMLICGNIIRIGLEGETMYMSKLPKKFRPISLLFRMSLPHQGLFTNRAMFEKYGLFDIQNRFCMDYEILLRAYHDFPPVILRSDVQPISNWRADGLGNGKIREILNEYNEIKKKNHVAPFWILKIIHFWTIFKYEVALLISPGSYK